MTPRDVLTFIFSRKATILGVFLLVVLAVTVLTYVSPQSYTAQSTVLIERNRAPAMRSTFSLGQDLIEVINSEIAIVKSRTVMERVVNELAPHEQPRRPSLSQGITNFLVGIGLRQALPPYEKWIDTLSRHVKVRALENSNVLYISYSNQDPAFAQRVVNAVTDAYIAHHLAVFSTQGLSDFYFNQMQEIEARLNAARRELAEYKASISVSAVDETQRAYLREFSSLRERISTAQSELAELRANYEPGHELVEIKETQIAGLEQLEADVRARLQELEIAAARIAEYTSRIQAEEEAYSQVKRDYDAARLAENSNSELINVRLIDYAALPQKAPHSRLFYIAISVILGGIMALMIAFVREYFDRRIHHPDEVEQILGLPSLGSVAEMGGTT